VLFQLTKMKTKIVVNEKVAVASRKA